MSRKSCPAHGLLRGVRTALRRLAAFRSLVAEIPGGHLNISVHTLENIVNELGIEIETLSQLQQLGPCCRRLTHRHIKATLSAVLAPLPHHAEKV